MGKHRKVSRSSAPDPWQRGTFLVLLARLALEVIRWFNRDGPGL
jgi:hypothetical protein